MSTNTSLLKYENTENPYGQYGFGENAKTMFEKIMSSNTPSFVLEGGQTPNNVTENAIILPVKKVEKESLLNFELIPHRQLRYIHDTEQGEKEEVFYSVEVIVTLLNGCKRSFNTIVDSSKIKNTSWLMEATNSLADVPREKREKAEYTMKVQLCIESESMLKEIIYQNAGWRNIDGIGWRYVYGDGIIGENNSLIHTQPEKYSLDINWEYLGLANTFDQAMKTISITPNVFASRALWLFLHATVMCTLFEKAGYPLNFVMGIAGVTNSRKTSLVLALTKLFAREKLLADAEFATATDCGIEKTLRTYQDAVVIIDDFKPGVNRTQQNMMDRKLDQLIRLYGNRVTKKRMTEFMPKGEKKYFPINGGCVLTMELVTGVMSSLSRMFITELEYESVDNNVLGYYQKEKWIIPTHIYDFVAWLTPKFNEIIVKIRNRFEQLRKMQKFEFERYSEMYATLMMVTEIIGDYALEKQFLDQKTVSDFWYETNVLLINELNRMGAKAKYKDKTEMVGSAIKDILVKDTPITLTSETAPKGYDSYCDDNYVYVRLKFLKKCINDFSRTYYESFYVTSDDELLQLLEKMNLLEIIKKDSSETESKICSRKLPIQRGNRQRYLYLKKTVIDNLFEE